MPSNGLEFYYEQVNKDPEIHPRSGSLRRKANYRVPYFVPEHDICVWSILLLKQYRWKNSYLCLGKTNENGSKNSVFPPWPTLDCLHKECEHQLINVFLYPPSSLHIYTLLTLFKILFTFSQYCARSKTNTARPPQPYSQKKEKRSDGQSFPAGSLSHVPWLYSVFPFSPRISKLVSGICPSKPKQASLLLTRSFPINLKTRVSLSFHFVFWGFLQGAITLGQQQPEMLLVLHRSQFCLCSLRMPQGKNKNVRTSPFLSPARGPCDPFRLGIGSKVFCSHHPLTP